MLEMKVERIMERERCNWWWKGFLLWDSIHLSFETLSDSTCCTFRFHRSVFLGEGNLPRQRNQERLEALKRWRLISFQRLAKVKKLKNEISLHLYLCWVSFPCESLSQISIDEKKDWIWGKEDWCMSWIHSQHQSNPNICQHTNNKEKRMADIGIGLIRLQHGPAVHSIFLIFGRSTTLISSLCLSQSLKCKKWLKGI